MEKIKQIEKALTIRLVEQRLLDLFTEGYLNGTIHTCIGQEFASVAIFEYLTINDTIFSNHRGHGHFISRTGNVEGLISEIMGKDSGVCKGVGGSQHLKSKNYFSNGIQGGLVPIACGSALYHKSEDENNIAVVFIGDGTFGEGILYEALNIASKWELPILIVVENNKYAQSTSWKKTLSGSIKNRAKAFDIEYQCSNTWEWEELFKHASSAINYVRKKSKPLIIEIETYRLKAHSKGDDNRDKSEVDKYNNIDPLNILIDNNNEVKNMMPKINNKIEKYIENAKKSLDCNYSPIQNKTYKEVQWSSLKFNSDRIVKIINESLDELLNRDNQLFLIGEDIEGDYGGAFKVTKNLSKKYGNRVKNTPISEGAIVGLGTGLALKGYNTIVEIMFGDFMTLTFDQLLQQASKICEMYGERLNIPLIIRTPMGGKRGYGPTHSQSIEKFFLGINNLDVIALNYRVSPKLIYNNIYNNINKPTLIVENKILYTKNLNINTMSGFKVRMTDEKSPCLKISPLDENPDVTIVCYGGTLEDAELAIENAFYENEILCEIICPSKINPINIYPIEESILLTKKLLIIEEGTKVASFSSEVCALLSERSKSPDIAIRISYDHIIPSNYMKETELLPNKENIYKAIVRIADG